MSQIEGFLSDDLSSSVANIRRDFASWFDVATAFNALGMRVLPKVTADQASNQQLIAATLYGRTLTSFQAVFLLSERGMLSDARTVVRAATETAIVLVAVLKDETICDRLVERHFWHHRKLRNAWLNDPAAIKEMTTQDVAAIEACIADIDAQHPTVKELKRDPIEVAALASAAGVTDLYNAVYRPTSGDAAHTSIDALNRNVHADAQANITGLKFGPDVSDLTSTLSDSMSVLGHALHAVIEHFQLKEFDVELHESIAQWKGLGIPARFANVA